MSLFQLVLDMVVAVFFLAFHVPRPGLGFWAAHCFPFSALWRRRRLAAIDGQTRQSTVGADVGRGRQNGVGVFTCPWLSCSRGYHKSSDETVDLCSQLCPSSVFLQPPGTQAPEAMGWGGCAAQLLLQGNHTSNLHSQLRQQDQGCGPPPPLTDNAVRLARMGVTFACSRGRSSLTLCI